MRTPMFRGVSMRGGFALPIVLCLALVVSLLPMAAFAVPMPDDLLEPDAYEVDDIQAMAKPIAPGDAPQAHTIHSPLDRDWVKFSAKADGYYRLDATMLSFGMAASDPMVMSIEVYDSEGNLLDASNPLEMFRPGAVTEGEYLADSPPYPAEMIFHAEKAGTYYVRLAYAPELGRFPLARYAFEVTALVPSITGVVTDSNGDPIPDVLVYANGSGMYPTAADLGTAGLPTGLAITDENGEYVLAGLPRGEYIIYFEPSYWDEFQSEWYDDASEPWNATPVVVAGTASVTSGIDAQLEPYVPQLSGRVVDETGEPAWGTEVVLYASDGMGGWYSYWSMWTDENGEFGYYGLYDGAYKIRFNDSGNYGTPRYVSEWYEDAEDVGTASQLTVTSGVPVSIEATIDLLPVAARGAVVDEQGEPVDAMIRLYDESQYQVGYTYTDIEGRWTWSTGVEGTQTVRVHVDPYDSALSDEYYDDAVIFEDADSVEAGTATPPMLETTLSVSPPSVSGVITDSITGEPIEGAEVWLYRAWDYDRRSLGTTVVDGDLMAPFESTMTDEDGYYEFRDVYDSALTLRFFDPSGVYAQEFYDDVTTLRDAEIFYVGDPDSDVVIDEQLSAQDGRIYDADRFGTAAAITAEQFPGLEGIDTVVLASGDDRAAADPLGASSLCWAYDAPLLLTSARGIPEPTAALLEDIEAVNDDVEVLVVGGPVSVPDSQLDDIEDLFGADSVERLPFGDRFETARQVALRVHDIAQDRGEDPGFVMIANGADPSKFFDALSASAVSASTGAPILLCSASSIPSATLDALGSIGHETTYLIGGPASVPQPPVAQFTSDPTFVRISGADRFATSVAVAQKAVDLGWLGVSSVGVAAKVPDALAGGVSVGRDNGPLLVTSSVKLPGVTYGFLDKYDQMIGQVTVFGGPKSVEGPVTTAIEKALK